jgi:hypothetical protein
MTSLFVADGLSRHHLGCIRELTTGMIIVG